MNDEFRVIDDIKEEEEEDDDDDDDGTKHENTPLRLQSKGGTTVLFSNPRCCYIRCMYKDITKKAKNRHDDHFTCAKMHRIYRFYFINSGGLFRGFCSRVDGRRKPHVVTLVRDPNYSTEPARTKLHVTM